MEVVVSPALLSLYLQYLQYALHRRLGRHQGQSGCLERETFLAFAGDQALDCSVCSLVTVLTILSQCTVANIV